MNLDTKIQMSAHFAFAKIRGPRFTLKELGLTEEEADAIVTQEQLTEALEPVYLKWLLSISGNVIEVIEDEEDPISDSGSGDAECSED